MTIKDRIDDIFERPPELGITLALVVLQGGELVAERYGESPDTPFGRGGPVDADTRLISWSTAKSITHAAVGVLVKDGAIDPTAPAAVPAWAGTDKECITLLDLLEMRPGLRFVEDYVDGDASHCIDMLFGSGSDDHAAYAAALPLDHPPGAFWNYSSGTTNIICRIIGDIVGGGRDRMDAFLRERLFHPIGMHSAIPKFDTAGTFIGSSYVYATARDFARFGELYRNDGTVDGRRILPEGWRDHARTYVASDEDGLDYGRHWWLWRDQPGSLACHGYEGQYCIVLPDRESVVVHLGKTPADVQVELTSRLHRLMDSLEP